MLEKLILVDVFVDNHQIDHFEFPLKLGDFITFPEDKPYCGLRYYITVGPNNTYEFSPDGYELWIRFNDTCVGRCVEYLNGKSYLFTFKTKTIN